MCIFTMRLVQDTVHTNVKYMFSEAVSNTILLYNITLQASKITSELRKHCTKYTVAVRIYVKHFLY